MFIYFIIFVLSFATMWVASDFVVSGMSRLSNRFNISSFAVSFFVLGILTSLPELSISLTSTIEGKPEIFVGTLIGASTVLFLFVIPLLAIIGNGINVNHDLPSRHLLLALAVVILPAFSTLNGRLFWQESIIMAVLYILLFIFIHKRKGIVETVTDTITHPSKGTAIDVLKVLVGIALILGASIALVESVGPIARFFHVPQFVLSLLLLSIGTNLPELFVAIQAVLKHDKDIALGDYIGSAAANTLIFSIMTLVNKAMGKTIVIKNGEFFVTFLLFFVGLILFFYVARTKEEITRKEGFALLFVYILFVASELFLR